MKKQNVRTIALIFCTFTYLLIGAAIFDALEASNEVLETKKLKDEENMIREKYNISIDDMEILTLNIMKAKPYRAGIQWKFAGSFYFALSVITTIGYGHSTPRTLAGKIFCIFYSIVGIPLNIVMFQSIGERFNIGITKVLNKFKRWVRPNNVEVTQTELTAVACFLCSAVLLGGAAAFSKYEDWTFINAFYYCFITMSTIGFGDFVALQNSSMRALQKKPEYVAFSILYIIFGLTVFAAALNLMVLRLLTMNTEDERKDELEAIALSRGAVKLDGDIITSATQNTTGSSLGRGVEGVLIEAGDGSGSQVYHPSCLKMQESSHNANGVITNNLNKKSPGLSWMLPDEDSSLSTYPIVHGHLCTPSSEIVLSPTMKNNNSDQQEEIASIETVLATGPTGFHSTKRGSV